MSETLRKFLKARKKGDIQINKDNAINELARLGAGNRVLSLEISRTPDAHIIYEQPDGKRYYQKIIFK